MTTHDGAPHGRGMAWATLLVSGGISWGVNLWHAFDQVPGGRVGWWYGSIAVLYGTAPVVLAALQSHSAAFAPLGRKQRILTYALMLLGMVLSIKAQAVAVEPFTDGEMRWLFPLMVDLSAFLALHTLMTSRLTIAQRRAELAAEVKAPSRPRHVICKGSTDGTLFLARPARKKVKSVPADLGVETGQRVHDLASVLAGRHSPIVYFLVNGDRVKIGTSTHLRPRIRRLALRVDNLALVLAGDAAFEGELHRRFAAHRDGDTEWFEMTGEVKAFVDAGGQPATVDKSPVAGGIGGGIGGGVLAASGSSASTAVATSGATGSAASGGQVATEAAPVARHRSARSGGKSRASGKRTRRSMTEWVELAEPLFHSEMTRLHRQPTGDEFAEAIRKAGFGSVSASTAKNIRTEILDRVPVPALEDLS